MEISTGHEAEMATRKEEELLKPNKNEMANYLLNAIRDVLNDNFTKLFDTKENEQEKINRIKSLITQYGF